MKKKIVFIMLMLISMILIMGGTAFAVNCDTCGDDMYKKSRIYK